MLKPLGIILVLSSSYISHKNIQNKHNTYLGGVKCFASRCGVLLGENIYCSIEAVTE